MRLPSPAWTACSLLLRLVCVVLARGERTKLFELAIDVGEDQAVRLPVFDGDVPSKVAAEFSEKWGLGEHGASRSLSPQPYEVLFHSPCAWQPSTR